MTTFLYLIEADLTSGATRCALELVKRLKNTDFRPIVVTQHKNDFNDVCNQLGIENYHFHYARICSLGMGFIGWLIAFFTHTFLNFLALKYLEKKIDFKNISFIHSNGSSIDFGAYLHKKKNITHIWHVRDFFLFDGTWRPLVKNFPLYLEKNSTKVVTVSKSLEEHLVKNGCSPQKVRTIYDGIDINSEQKRTARLSSTKELLHVACVGQICRSKGQETLVDAIIQMTETERSHFVFDFYGELKPDVKDVILDKIIKHKLGKIVVFKGYSKNILHDLNNYDIGVQPSHSEGFSRVTAEYMAAGLCVIAAKEGAIPELIQHNENGLLYEDFNSTELKDQLNFCFQNQEKMHALAKNAQAKFFNNYDIEINVRKILELYQSMS